MLVFSIQARKTKICTAVIWGISLFLNFLPFLSSIGYDENTKENKDNWSKDGLEISYETKDALFISYITVANLGLLLPLVLTIIAYIIKIIFLNNKKQNKETRKDVKNNEKFRKLINGLVVWLIVCNAPYIYWLHWALFIYMDKTRGNFMDTVAGVIISFLFQNVQ